MEPSKQEIRAGLEMVMVVSEAIREAGEIPSGVLYSFLIGRIDFEGYSKMIALLKRTGLVEEKNHLLRWVGPKVPT